MAQEDLSETVITCWSDLLALSRKPMPLPATFAAAEKLVQYCKLSAEETDLRWLKQQIENSEEVTRIELAIASDNLDRKRVHAAMKGAEAGFTYPLGRSPRDLNGMAF